MGLFDFLKKDDSDTPESLYNQAKLISEYLFQFPYIDPSTVDPSLRKDKPLMDIILFAHKTTIGTDGRTCQTTIDAAERIRYQSEFKKRIYELLDKCLSLDSNFAPAFLLYPKVAEWNTRASDRPGLISIYEKFSSKLDQITKGSRAYSLIKKDIEGRFGNYYDRVERYLADFYYEFGNLYLKQRQLQEAIKQFQKAETLMPFIYAGAVGDAYANIGDFEKALSSLEEALKLPIEKNKKDFIEQHYQNIKSAMEKFKSLLREILVIVEQNQGILQKDIYSKLGTVSKDDISAILRTLDKRCLILRKKKGSTYQLTLDKSIPEILEIVKQLHIEQNNP